MPITDIAAIRPKPAAASGRIQGLDGLRAVAVLAVVAYHLDAPWMPGGFLGVDLFMVLSGYLITRLLLVEWDRTSRIDVPAFWIRRAKRLLPAAVTLVVVVSTVAALLFASDQLGGIRGDALAATFYVANWRFIAAKASYFDLFSEASPFRHLWSLAIEEQFYVVWPVVVLALRRSRRLLLPATAALMVASAVEMVALADPSDPSRAYYGTDTRAQTLLAGCLLAMVLHGRSWSAARRLQAAALAAFAGAAMIVTFVVVHDSDRYMYRGGFLSFALLGSLLVGATVVSEGLAIVRVLEHRAIAAIGKGSYSIYLWHWPAIVFLSPTRLDLGTTSTNAIRLGATAAAAFVSYRWIESPIRHRSLSRRAVGGGVLAAAALTSVVIVVATARATAPAPYFSATGQVIGGQDTPVTAGGAVPVPRILVLGDSVVASLSDSLVQASIGQPLVLAAAPVSGCGLLPGFTLDTTTQVIYEPSRGCAATVNAAIDTAIAQFRPTIVVWLSVWDAENREIDGQRIALETDDGRAALAGLIGDRVDAFAARGIATVLVTDAPVGQSGTLGEPPSIKQDRIAAYDDVLRGYVADHPNVGLIDLAAQICPTGAPCADIAVNGEAFRPNDGIHFQGEPALEVSTWLVGELAAGASAWTVG